MTGFPDSPKVLKGALVAVTPLDVAAGVIVFQYNPDTLTRTLRMKAAGNDADKSEVLRLKGPPDESIKLDVELDAADQLDAGDSTAVELGVYPALSRLEVLLHPSSTRAIANEVLALFGVIEFVQPEAPLTLLVWGRKRVLPVRLTGLSVVEEAFDLDLNPVRAKVNLELTVLNYQDLGLISVGGGLYLAHQMGIEALSRRRPSSLGATGIGIGL
jgi:hypothetical protein